MIPCICINNANMPTDFPNPSIWLKKDSEYQIERVNFVTKSRTIGVQLAGFKHEDCDPYLYFKLDRFAIPEDQFEALYELFLLTRDEKISGVDDLTSADFLELIEEQVGQEHE